MLSSTTICLNLNSSCLTFFMNIPTKSVVIMSLITPDEILRDRLVLGIRDDKVRERLL